jgi:flavin-binding protein dodecin
MDNHIYKIIELTGSSSDSVDAAIQNAIGRASRSLHNLRWFQVLETRGDIENDRVAHYQVTLKVGFTVDD